MYDTWGDMKQDSNRAAMHIRDHGTNFSRAGGLASGIYASMSSLIELYQKCVRHIPFLHATLLNNKTYCVKRSRY